MMPRSQAPLADEAVVLVLDDDLSMRKALSDLIESVGLRVHLYASVPELLGRPFPTSPAASFSMSDCRARAD